MFVERHVTNERHVDLSSNFCNDSLLGSAEEACSSLSGGMAAPNPTGFGSRLGAVVGAPVPTAGEQLMTESYRERSKGERGVGPTIGSMCVTTGDGLHTSMARQLASFIIESRDSAGRTQPSGGDRFVVSIRGASSCRAKVRDRENGSYEVSYRPSTSGSYTIAATLNGVSLPGSPFAMEVLTPAPNPPRCKLSGAALEQARARELMSFECEFIDALGQPARAEELDVWVERADPSEQLAAHTPSTTAASTVEAPSTKSRRSSKEHIEREPPATPLSEDAATPAAGAPATPANGSPSPAESFRPPATTSASVATTSSHRSATPESNRKPERMTLLKQFRQLDLSTLARSGGRVEVGSKPLIMRQGRELDSEVVSTLRPGQLVTVLEQVEMGGGKLRARVVSVDEEEGGKSVAESWWSPMAPTEQVRGLPPAHMPTMLSTRFACHALPACPPARCPAADPHGPYDPPAVAIYTGHCILRWT